MEERETTALEEWDDTEDPTRVMPAVEEEPTQEQPEGEPTQEMDQNLLGEPTDPFPAKKGGPSTVYVVFALDMVDLEIEDHDGETEVWVERGQVVAPGGRSAIIEIVGDEEGDFMAVPESSAKRHKRRAKTVYAWEDQQ